MAEERAVADEKDAGGERGGGPRGDECPEAGAGGPQPLTPPAVSPSTV